MKHSSTVVQLKEAWFSSIMICHQICNKSITTRVTCVAEPVYPSGVPEFTTGLFTLLEHQSSPPVCLPFWNTRVHPRSAYPSGTPEFTPGLFILLEHQSSPPVYLPFWNTRVHPRSVYPSGTPEFTPGLLILLEHQSSPPVCLPFWNTRVHHRSVYPSGTPEFTPGLFTLLEHQSSPPVCLPFWNTRVHHRSVYSSGTPEFTPGFQWVSYWSIFSFLCNVLWIIVCPFPFGNVLSVLLFTTSHDLWQTFLVNGYRLP